MSGWPEMYNKIANIKLAKHLKLSLHIQVSIVI